MTYERKERLKMTDKKHNPRAATPFDIEVGKRLKRERLAKNVTQEGLSDKLDITFQQIQKYEKGKNKLGLRRALQICAALDIEINTLIEGISL